LSTEISQRKASATAWLYSAVFTLDRWLRRRQGVYEYTVHPECLFRIQCVRVEGALEFADGTSVAPGSRALALHLWNEHVPVMGQGGPTLAWARKTSRAIHASLCELARYLGEHPELDDICVIYGDMRVSGTQAARLAQIVARYGFETVSDNVDGRGLLRRLGDGLLVMMLVSVTNPLALRSAVLRHSNVRIYLSRAVLEERYFAPEAAPAQLGRGRS
jgi:hypothetical protein